MILSKRIKRGFDKFWFLLWKDESLKGWVLSILVIFLFIKFIFFPTLSFVTGTTLPLAIVESCSMYHERNLLSDYDEWFSENERRYSEFSIGKEVFNEFRFKDGLNKGDILLIIGTNPEKLEVGDVIIFSSPLNNNPIIHRIVEIKDEDNKKIFSTIGDNNNGQLSFEKNIDKSMLIGKAGFKIAPYLGWGKLIFYEGKRDVSQRGFCQ